MTSLIWILAMLAADQLVKLWAVKELLPVGSMDLIPGVFSLTYIENRGAAFSFLQNQTWFFILVTLGVLGAMIYAWRKKWVRTRFGRIALVLVAGGAVGNFLDRIVRHFVVDMFNFYLIGFPVFNVADVFITIGGIMFAYYILFQHDPKESEKETADE